MALLSVCNMASMKKKIMRLFQNGKDKAMDTHIQEFQKRNVPVAIYAYVNGKSEKKKCVKKPMNLWTCRKI